MSVLLERHEEYNNQPCQDLCQGRNRQIVKSPELHFDAMTFPMEFISMDLIGELHPPFSKGYKYALTIICMLSGYVFCKLLYTKTAEEVIQAYIANVYAKFGGSFKILSDNGTEFKNKLFEQKANKSGPTTMIGSVLRMLPVVASSCVRCMESFT